MKQEKNIFTQCAEFIKTYFSSIRIIVIVGLLITIFFTFSLSFLHFETYKQDLVLQISEYIDKAAFPYRVAKLRSLPPDNELTIPIRDLTLKNISNNWGDPRSGGRSHQGIDMFAKRGTPVYAVVPGYVWRIGQSTLGGNYVYTIGAGGVRYYYAHLDSYAAGLAVGDKVNIDTVLGFVGNTGNASTTPPHLHFGMYDRGPHNPYTLLRNRN